MTPLIKTGPTGTIELPADPQFHRAGFTAPRRRPRAMDALLQDALAGKIAPLDTARASRLLHNPQSRFSRFRLCLNATPRVFGYALQNVPKEFQPISLLGRLTYAGVLASMACRKLWGQEIGLVRLPGVVMFKGRAATPEEIALVREEGAARYQLRQNGEVLIPEAFCVVLENTASLLSRGDIVIEERP